MLLVNLQASEEHAFPGTRHAGWHGLTPADFVFPAFLLVAGASMAQSSRLGHARLLRRAGVLVALGLVVNGLFRVPLETLRLPGVLQRIGLASLLAGLVVLHVRSPRAQMVLASAVLAGYWAALALVPVPGHGAGDLSPAGNLAGYVDRTLLGPAHLHGGGPNDPEGLLSTVPAAVTVLAGVWAGRALRASPTGGDAASPGRRAVSGRLAVAGVLAVAAGAAWHPLFPVNKRLWTSSFVLVTAGAGLLLLAAVHATVGPGAGRRGWGRGLEHLGRNAIAVYVLSSLVASVLETTTVRPGGREPPVPVRQWIYEEWFVPWAGPTWGSMAHAVAFLALWWALAAVLGRRGWYIRV